ncbi:antibiotic biosynthesis monooxygenase [Aliikangiella marina]|uniref:Antibiotic biosynthesis monooxygenase n=1 Tax=Aliikangiella marina TaxID=1712262 RepID=A0A545T8X8_9GAMM|nr:antibiotic biosynthesis monooxygenase family protein [Aliikangiella marina]TQV73674.1 antibiotic biosynthesis monooxygenase [Aliikangiella marina]
MIRVIIERHIKEGCFHDYLDMIRRARKQATAVEGFIAGELLQENANANHAVIISSWENLEAWNKWQSSDERAKVLTEMRPLLESDESVTVLESSQLMS